MLSPIPDSKWNYEKAAHLLNRAGFGGPPSEIEELVKLGPVQAVARFVNYGNAPVGTPAPEWAKADPERFQKAREFKNATEEKRRELRKMQQQQQRQELVELRGWWLERMANGQRPLEEKLTLFWHGHFATSAQKVKSSWLMYRQNETLRQHASGNWEEMLKAVSRDPAMLMWLDQAQSKKDHPNENYARELLELFTLGEGNYSEKDVTEAARALTGFSFDRVSQEFTYRKNTHDAGPKTILGKTESFDGDGLIKLIVGQPQAAKFICKKLWSFLAAENPSEELISALAAKFRASGNNFKPLLETMFLGEEFYSEKVVRQQVKSPVQWLVGSARVLERPLPPTQVAMTATRALGQDLFMPPNVKGWDGGVAWITTNNLLNRYNFANYLVLGENLLGAAAMNGPRLKKGKDGKMRRMIRGTPVQASKLVPAEFRTSPEKVIAELERRLIQGKFTSKSRAALKSYLEGQGELDDEDVLQCIRLAMSTPEFQLC